MNKLIITLVSLALLLSGCEGTSSRYDGSSGKKGSTKEMIEANIDTMGAKKWDKKTYMEIVEYQIPEMKLQSDADALLSLLNTTYSKVLVRDANEILDGTCSPSHALLYDLVKEAENFSTKGEGYDAMKAKYDKHEQLLKFINRFGTLQKVKIFTDRYDEAFETTMSAQAKEHLSTNPTCKYIRDALSNPESRFYARRKAYCEAIVDLYVNKEEYTERDENRVRARLNKWYPDKLYPGDKQALIDKMDKFKADYEAKLNRDTIKEEVIL